MNHRGLLSSDTVHLGKFDATDFIFEEWTATTCEDSWAVFPLDMMISLDLLRHGTRGVE